MAKTPDMGDRRIPPRREAWPQVFALLWNATKPILRRKIFNNLGVVHLNGLILYGVKSGLFEQTGSRSTFAVSLTSKGREWAIKHGYAPQQS